MKVENQIDNKVTDSVWKQTMNGDWKMFFNTDTEMNQKVESESQIKLLIDNGGKRTLKIGLLVMSPKGIGRLINLEEGVAKVKFANDDTEDTYEESTIHHEVPIYIRVLEKDYSNWYRIEVPANGNVESLKKTIEDLKIIDNSSSNYILIYNGVEIRDDNTFESLDLRANSKILLCIVKMTPCKMARFNTTYNWWYTYNVDGLTFSVNKKIKLSGVGLYGSHEGKVQNATLKIFEGTCTSMGPIFYEEPVEIPAAPEQNNCITQILFKKPVVIKPNIEYTIQLVSTNYCYLYYGNGGKNSVEGEKGVEFLIKYTPGSSHGSGVESGNFPEFYYYA